ncbi:hypothetical protein G7077_01790 [Sphingomonas piscis]|uniref:Uncharacterized protein n=1 Tax=Sphingomonas piscis TaxID=2714943 RepID=A0A6G7YM68_9SPHN|nr:hypothetical protein [Sphingomonas piscis]QIK77832.1 hypothetical protein G7077_01790 [Sphingomonas piscis]
MMDGRTTQAGGCLLALSILGGLIFGIVQRAPTLGAIIGTAVGIVIALAVWLIDKRRSA